MKNKTGIYMIKNICSNKVYIGKSSDIERRIDEHKRGTNAEHSLIDRDILKFGPDSFNYEVLEECSVENLSLREKFYIEKYNSYINGYNQSEGGEGANVVQKEKVISKYLKLPKSLDDKVKIFTAISSNVKGINDLFVQALEEYFNNPARKEFIDAYNKFSKII